MRKLCLQGTFVDIDGKIKIKQQKKFAPLTKTGFAQIAVSFVPCTITFNLHFIMHKQTKITTALSYYWYIPVYL